jgi:branched-chain amino acid transport system substrate-binding protein
VHYPYTVGFVPTYYGEGTIYGRYIVQHWPNAKIGVLRQDDDYGRDFLDGVKRGLGPKAGLIISDMTYQPTDPTVESQVVSLKGSGADLFINITTPKFAAQSIRKAAEIGWRPTQFLNDVSSSIGAVLIPAGPQNAVGIISADYVKDITDPAWSGDPAVAEFLDFMKHYAPQFDPKDKFTETGFLEAQLISEVLRRCGDTLTHENVMRQVTHLDHVKFGLLLPGITINVTPTDYNTIANEQLVRFDGKYWERFGEVMSGL